MHNTPSPYLLLSALCLLGLRPLGAAAPALPEVTLTAMVDVTDETGRKPALVRIERNGDLSGELPVRLVVGGTAREEVDYKPVPREFTLPEGSASAEVPVIAVGDFEKEDARTVVLRLGESERYSAATKDGVTIRIDDVPPKLFVAILRPTEEAPESTGFGTASLQLSPDRARARVVVSHANLTSPLVSSHLKLGLPKRDGDYLLNFRGEDSVAFDWAMQPSGRYSSEDLRDALEKGLVYAALDTRRHPTGELRGAFLAASGSEKFAPPPAPPRVSLQPKEARDVARFLIQATFGPTKEEIDEFLAPTPKPNEAKPKPMTYQRWIFEQMAIPATSHLELTRVDYREFKPDKPKAKMSQANRQVAWWTAVLTGPDQLRQRVAFALSEIFVVSDRNDLIAGNPEAAAAYYDLLARDAFGNFRTLLEDVTLSPVMGAYLSHLRNAKADPEKGTSADENYAREVMQLFTIGLNELQPDGTLRLGADGMPLPTYDQKTITEMAKVFTGWGFYTPEPPRGLFSARSNFSEPMMLYPEAHDDGPKTVVGGTKLAAKAGGAADLRATLDALFEHPNTGPFVCRQLIQRLVTSNPSPGYVYRVAKVFADNGRGVRGDLGAVVRAILLDYEARSPEVLRNFGYGKLKEPLLQATALLRAFGASSKSGRYHLPNPEGALAQAALRSPTVFNFFEPYYVQPGALAAAGLYAPEYQIFTDTTAISVPNFLRNCIYTGEKSGENALVLDLAPLLPLAKDPDSLLNHLTLVFCAGAFPEKARAIVRDALAKLPPSASDPDRVRTALDLVVTSPYAAVQR